MRSLSTFAGVAFSVVLLATASAAQPRVVNVTPDSAPGWTPSAEQEQAATAAMRKYLAARDAGRATEAYAQLDPLDAATIPATEFASTLEAFNRQVGAVQERRVTMLTWTKDPPSAPAKGVYAAFDLVSRFVGADRHCGYIVMHQAQPGGPFLVAREESAFMDNATAAAIEKKQSRHAVDALWLRMSSAGCPNYKAPLPEAEAGAKEYPSVAAALTALKAKAGVKFSEQNGWTIATDEKALTMWSFAPRGNLAYPAFVKRQVVTRDGATWVETSAQCEASKEACDDMMRGFEQLTDKATGGR